MFKVFLIVLALPGNIGGRAINIQELKTMDECISLKHEVSEMYTHHQDGMFDATYTNGFKAKCVKIKD